jgi:subtilase family serine protease
MHSETQFVSVAATRELRALRHLRFVVWLPVVAALCLAGAASATPMRPATTNVPFSQISSASARAALQTPFCPQVNLVCYSPAHLQQAYDYPTGRKAPTGAGQTIMVVTAFGSPFIQADLAQFDAENGLPDPPSFTIVNQQTIVSANSSNDFFKWAVETSLDVEYAHAMAPGANIVLAVAATDDSKNFAQLEKEALPRFPTAIVTQSFGGDETGEASDPAAAAIMDRLFLNQVQHGGTVVASSGDLGASGFTPFSGPPVPMAGYPAASPFVLSVGGTMGDPFPTGLWSNGHYGGEQAWNELVPFDPGAGAGGGAPSVVYHAPPWQLGLTGSTMRAVPDVSYNAAPTRRCDAAAVGARTREERLSTGLPRHHDRFERALRPRLRLPRLLGRPGVRLRDGPRHAGRLEPAEGSVAARCLVLPLRRARPVARRRQAGQARDVLRRLGLPAFP